MNFLPWITLTLGAIAAFCALPSISRADNSPAGYAVGADLSFLPEAEAHGLVFKDNGQLKPGLQIFKDHGYNWIRLRLFHAPSALPNDLTYTIAEAKQAKALGYHVLLDLHYSDTWADGGHQITPAAWQTLSHTQLVQTVFTYTRDTIAAFRQAGAMPDMVQIGNEISSGMLWPDGKLPQHWSHFADLLNAGIRGVAAGSGAAPHPRIMIHIDRGGDLHATQWFFDTLATYHVPFDVIGQSYYPWWQGSLLQLHDNLVFMAEHYHKDIYVVETAYNWRPGNYSAAHPGPFPETPDGQKAYLQAVNQIVLETPGGHGAGVFWWEPAVTAAAGGPGIHGRGMFDDANAALPVLTALDPLTRW